MASPYLTEQAGLIQSPEVVGLERQRKLADLLTSQAFQSPQGQMISGHYVKPATTQQLQPLLSALLATNMNQNLDEKQLQMAAALRNEENAGIDEYQRIKTEQGPAAANAYLAKSKISALRGAGLKEMFAPPIKAGVEDVLLDPNTFKPLFTGAGKLPPSTQLAIVNLGLPKDPSTWTSEQQKMAANYIPPAEKQHLDISRANLAISQARLNDEGIGGGGGMPQALRGQSNTQNAAGMPTQLTGKQPTFETPQPPPGLSPKQNREWFAKASEPLTGEPAKKVSGALNYQQALDNYKSLISNFTAADIANPQKRVLLTEAYNTVTLTGKEAFNLGVLNGGDERIINGLQPNFNNPSALLVTQKTAQQIANNQKNYAANVINNEYKVHQKIVPQNLRQFVAITEQSSSPQPQSQIDPKLLQYMTPEQQALFGKPRQ
jgi:hypothetical protein